MFQNLGDKLSKLVSGFGRSGLIKETDIDKIIGEIRSSLLDADTHPDAVNFLAEELKKEAVGQDIHKALNASQQITKLLHKSLSNILGKETNFDSINDAQRILLVGLQGSGKTTTVAKIAKYFKDKGKNPLVGSVDFSRPAALEQLKTLSSDIGVQFYEAEEQKTTKLIKSFQKRALINQNDISILDTAGRVHLDKDLMKELKEIDKQYKPTHVFLVVDSMVGRQIVDIARSFNETIPLSGFILSKMDSDTKGGAALSAYYATKKPVYFIGTGEQVENLEEFHPERIASRILDLGDMLSITEKLEQDFDEKEQKKLEQKIKKNQFDIEDFYVQLKQIKKMGSVGNMLSMLPGGRKLANMAEGVDTEGELAKIEVIINSMTKKEKQTPSLIDNNRKKRIASGSGTNMLEVNKFLKSFDRMKKMMKSLQGKNIMNMTNMFGRTK